MNVPPETFFDVQRDNFFKEDGRPCGTVFYRKWINRWNEFPRVDQRQTPELRYATRLLLFLWEKHWPDGKAKPLPDMMGVLTQIDNAVANLTKPKELSDEA